MNYARYCILLCVCIFALPFSLHSQELVEIKPFVIQAPKEYAYLSSALPTIIASRLTSEDITIVDDETKSATKPSIITGSVTALGKNLSVDIVLQRPNGRTISYPISTNVNDLLQEVEAVIPKIKKDILHASTTINPEQTAIPSSIPFTPVNKEPKPSISFINDPKGWQSALSLSIAPRGLEVVDIDDDGTMEYIILGEKQLLIYERKGNELVRKTEYKFIGREEAKYLAIAPLRENKELHILVTTMLDRRTPSSYIFSYSQGKLTKVVSQQPYLLGAYYNAEKKLIEPILQLVPSSTSISFFSAPVHIFDIVHNKIKVQNQLTLPSFANVFNFTTVPTQKSMLFLVLNPSLEQLSAYSSKRSLLYTTEDSYSSTSYYINLSEQLTKSSSGSPLSLYYIPTHFASITHNDTRVIFVAHATNRGKVVTDYRTFSKYTIEALSFDEATYRNLWRSEIINASLADIATIQHANGTVELFVLVTYTPKIASFQKERSAVFFQTISGGTK